MCQKPVLTPANMNSFLLPTADLSGRRYGYFHLQEETKSPYLPKVTELEEKEPRFEAEQSGFKAHPKLFSNSCLPFGPQMCLYLSFGIRSYLGWHGHRQLCFLFLSIYLSCKFRQCELEA